MFYLFALPWARTPIVCQTPDHVNRKSVARVTVRPDGCRGRSWKRFSGGISDEPRGFCEGLSQSSVTSMPFTHAIPTTGTKLRTILPWAVGRMPENTRSRGRPSPPASLVISKPLSRVTPLQ